MSDIKVALANAITTEIRNLGLTQMQVTENYGLQQSRVSNLINGNLKNIGVKKLLEMAEVMGFEISVKVRKKK